MYIVGIDVGGTNTDAALLRQGQVLAMAKTATNHLDLFTSTREALQKVLKGHQSKTPLELHLSTTLSTNTIVEGRGLPTEVVAVPGPGVNLSTLKLPFAIYEVQGYIDHRGREVAPLDKQELAAVRDLLLEKKAEAIAVVGKFSQRNPEQEEQIGALFQDWPETIVSLGHRLSGRANFPRRLVTAYLNASVAKQQSQFTFMWEELREKLGIPLADILVLKADGGTMSLADSRRRPVETILSGPAASIMGAQALAPKTGKNAVIVDIGGTTTDLAVVVQGEALFERSGAVIGGYRTLVPALLTRSLGLGGDSAIAYEDGKFQIGPQRAGLAACLGGQALTPTDAAVALGLAQLGEEERALAFCQEFGAPLGLTWREVAEGILAAFSKKLAAAVRAVYEELANVPLYTVSEILTPPSFAAESILGLGAPAPVFIPRLAQELGLPYQVLPFSAGANAIGAAAAQPTVGITLHADTELAVMTIPEMGYRSEIRRPLFFDLAKARQKAKDKTKEYARQLGLSKIEDVYVLEEESFNVVRGFHTVGSIQMVRTQLRPGVRQVKGGSVGE